jgi:RNA-directed DNA polymerase
VNTDAPGPSLDEAWLRVLKIQTKLHQWAVDDPGRRFDDLFNLVCDPAFLTVGWDRVRGNGGARSAGVDGVKPRSIVTTEAAFLARLQRELRSGEFTPLPVRQRMSPKGTASSARWGSPPRRIGSCKPA